MNTIDTLKHFKLRNTKIRVAVLEALTESSGAVSYGSLQRMLSQFDRTTLYRTLLVFNEKGLIHKAYEENGDSYYARCFGCSVSAHSHEHLHLKCSSCGGVECVEISDQLKSSLSQLPFQEINISAKGACSTCVSA